LRSSSDGDDDAVADWKLELVQVPVSDIDRAKEFYRDRVGFAEDFDSDFGEGVRMVQLTPPGSGCSIALVHGLEPGPGAGIMTPGSLNGLLIVVDDLTAAREQLVAGGVEVSEVLEYAGTGWRPVAGPPVGWNAYVFFQDPDGNGWMLQQRAFD
jgi:catechol 2,3-dioxygenase-like lactoylglutathione lyase family enzyme